MTCPNCGWTMNHHGDKALLETSEENPDLAAQTVEAYSCPHCGTNASRIVER